MNLFRQSLSKSLVVLTQVSLLSIAVLLLSVPAAQENVGSQMVGEWVINDDLSDNTDDQVEEAIEAGGGDGGRSFFNRQEDFYRGGPPEHELYDRISYDDILTIEFSEPEFHFTYEDNYFRVFHTDGRRRRTTASVEKGNFGSPTFFVRNEMFFGKDRLRDVEEEILAQQ